MARISYIEKYVDLDMAFLPEPIRKVYWWLRQVEALIRP